MGRRSGCSALGLPWWLLSQGEGARGWWAEGSTPDSHTEDF